MRYQTALRPECAAMSIDEECVPDNSSTRAGLVDRYTDSGSLADLATVGEGAGDPGRLAGASGFESQELLDRAVMY